MKTLTKSLIFSCAACLGGCAVYEPAPGYTEQPIYQPQTIYSAQPIYVQPAPVYVQPPVSFGLSLDFGFGGHGGWHGGHHHGWR